MLDYIKVFVLLVAVAVTSGFIVMQLAMRQGGAVSAVPDVTGKPIVTALETLNDSGYFMTITRVDFSPTISNDSVISQEPYVGEKLRIGSGVKVVISRGAEQAVIPNLVGSSLSRAKTALISAKIPASTVEVVRTYSDKSPKEIILAQKPLPKTMFSSKDGKVTLLVSDGPYPIYKNVPPVVGNRTREAMKRLEEAGFRVSKVRYSPSPLSAKGIVLSQEPNEGYRAVEGEAVALTVSEGAAITPGQKQTLTFFYFTVADNKKLVDVKIVQINSDGENEIYNRAHRGGDTLSVIVSVKGATMVKLYLDGELSESRRYSPSGL